MPTIAVKNSPNQSARTAGVVLRAIVLHADVASAAKISIDWLMRPEAKASYTVIVERDGSLTQLVPDERKAWHAGKASFLGRTDVNDFSFGICFSNRQDGVEPFTEAAIARGVEIVAAWMKKYPTIGLDGITTHEAVARPMGRKSDPGPLFPVAQFITRVRRALT